MIARIPRLAVAMLAAGVVSAAVAGTAGASSTTIYNNIPSPLPGDMENELFEGSVGTSELGGQVAFETGKWKNPNVSVIVVSSACESGTQAGHDCTTSPGAKFEWPITFNVYEVGPGNSVGRKIAAGSKTFKIPYRPSGSSKCTGAQEGEWYRMGKCFLGKAFKIALGLKVHELPEDAIISIAFNTTNYGTEPTNVPGPYDLLGFGLTEPPAVPSPGTNPVPNGAYVNAANGACWEGNTLGTFSLSTGACWEGYQPLIQVKATEVP